MADGNGGVAYGIGSLAEGFLAGRQANIAKRQQDLEQQKYEMVKQQQAVANTQKSREQDIQEEAGISQYGSGGYEYMQALKNRATSPQSQQAPQQPQAAAPSGNQDSTGNFQGPSSDDWANAMGAGALSKPPGSGFVSPPSPYSTVPSTTAQANPQQPQQGAGGLPPPVQPYAMKMAQFQKQLAMKQQADEANLKAMQSNSPQRFSYDPSADKITQTAQGMSPKDAAELNNLTSGNRSSQETGQKEFNANPSVTAARQSKVYMDQMVQSSKDPSPQGQASMFLNALRIKFPTAPDVGSLNELAKSESAPVQMRNIASKYLNGTMDPQMIQDLLRDGISTFESNAGGFREAQSDYQNKLVKQYGQTPDAAKMITHDSGIDATSNAVAAMKKQMGPYTGPADNGGATGWVANKISGLLGGVAKPSMAGKAPPKVGDVVKGFKYLGGDPSKQASWGQP